MPTDLDFNDDAELGDDLDIPGAEDTPGVPEDGSGEEGTPTPPESDAGIDISDYATIAPLWQGGWQTVPTLADRDSISSFSRDEGMAVHVFSNGKTYVLAGGITNDDWIEYRSGVAVDIEPERPTPENPDTPEQPDGPDTPGETPGGDTPQQPGGDGEDNPPSGGGSCNCGPSLETINEKLDQILANGGGSGGIQLPDGLSIRFEEITI